MTATASTISPQQKLAILRHLAAGKPADVVATITRLTRDEVVGLAKHHGYPDRDKLGWAADVLAKNLDVAERGRIPEGSTVPPSLRPLRTVVGVGVGPAARPVAAPTVAPAAQPDEIRTLLDTAQAHPAKRIRAAAAKVLADLDRLRGLISDDEQRNAAKRKAAAEKAAARAEVDRLKAQLAQAQAKLRGGKPATTAKKAEVNTGAAKPQREQGPLDYPCRNDGCDRAFDTPQGRSLHERMRCQQRTDTAS